MASTLIFVIFIVLQISDGVLTWYIATNTPAGLFYEKNPIAIAMIQKTSIAFVVFVLKSVSLIFGSIIYCYSNKTTFGIKNVYYLCGITLIMATITVMHIVALKILLGQSWRLIEI